MKNVLKYLLLALIAVSQLFACGGSDDEKTPADNFDVQFTVPGSVDVTEGGECTFAVSGGGKSPLTTDTFILESDAGISYVCPIVNTTSDSFTVRLADGCETGYYKVFVKRDARKKSFGRIYINIVEDIDFKPDAGTTVYGIVSSAGVGVENVVVSDGAEVTVTNEKGIYQLKSAKKWGYVFISVPSGYEVPSVGVLPQFHRALKNSADVVERADFKPDNIYVENVVALSQTEQTAAKNVAGVSEEGSRVYHDVVKGNKSSIVENVKKELESGKDPQTIIDEDLIPAVNKVGELFEQKKYFLPQLIAGATAMDLAIEYITPLLHIEENAKPKGTVIMATVEGDIHDIGKNLVVLMLKNYGYKVVDLGKDVPLDKIIAAAKEEHADIIGLSALMTTTMMRMKDAVEYVRANNLPYKVIIGGAVVSQNFADEIGADGYSKDANEAVKLVDKLLTDK